MNEDAESELEMLKALYYRTDEVLQHAVVDGVSVTVKLDIQQWKFYSGEDAALSGSHALQGQQAENDSHTALICFVLPHNYPSDRLQQVAVHCSHLSDEASCRINQQLDQQVAGEPSTSALELCSLAQELVEKEITSDDYHPIFHPGEPKGKKTQLSQNVCTQDTKSQKNYSQNTSSQNESSQNTSSLNKSSQNISSQNTCLQNTSSQKTSPHNKSSQNANSQNTRSHNTSSQNMSSRNNTASSQLHTAVYHLDHMRSRQNYVKLLRKWTSELGLTGRLMFAHKFIIILLQGESTSIKEYLMRNRTTNVDIDSKGRSCKERMLTVLFDGPVKLDKRFRKISEFIVLEGPLSQTDLREEFLSCQQEDLYTEFVKNIR